MTNSATITFSQAGVQPPVYLVTSLSDPPWQTLEMNVDKEHTASADPVFVRHFYNVREGDHQYKIRIGDGHWVVDESKDTATDDRGNRNNVIQVKPAEDAQSQKSTSDTTTEKDQVANELQQDKDTEPLDRKDSSMDPSSDIQLSSIPIPFVMVEKVADKEQQEHGDTDAHPLAPDIAKRTADSQPDFETTYEERQAEVEHSEPPDVPLMVEKTDNGLEHGDYLGDEATTGQKLAYDRRAADASPNEPAATPEGHVEPGTEEEQAAPLFRHESIQVDNPPSVPALDTIDEVSGQSSADQTSSDDNINTPGESQDEDTSSPEPLMPHEVNAARPYIEQGSGPLLSHESAIEEEQEEGDELSNGPLLSHETELNGDIEHPNDDEEIDELDAAPLLPHETGFSQYESSEVAPNSDFLEDDISEPRHYSYDDDDEHYEANAIEPDEAPTFTHKDLGGQNNDYGVDDAPLLPHERESAIQDDISPKEGGDFSLHGQPTFGYETDNAKELFGGNGRTNIFKTRANSSTLPHRLPPSDADDENLNDPSLERFPTNREQILQRVQTIGLNLPADEPEDDIHSPVMSVLSQACSSVDLAPVKSYTSLASVPEANDSDEEDMENGDMESLPSPMVLNLGRNETNFARDPHATPMPAEDRRVELNENNDAKKPASPSTRCGEADSVGKNDGAKDFKLSDLRGAIATPTKIFNTVTPPLTPENQDAAVSDDKAAPTSVPELRQRNVPKQDGPTDSFQAPANFDSQPENDHVVEPSSPKQLGQSNETFLQSFFRVVFGPLGRFLTACLGDRKRVGATVLVAGVAVTYYLLA